MRSGSVRRRQRIELLYKPVKTQQLHTTLLRLFGHVVEEPEEIVLTSGQSGQLPSLN